MRPPSIKLRTLIVLVALATLAVGAVAYRRRAALYRALATVEANFESQARASHEMHLADAERLRALLHTRDGFPAQIRRLRAVGDERGDALVRRMERHSEEAIRNIESTLDDVMSSAERASRRAEHHARRRAAYLRCARYPWLSPPGDEPEPK